MKRLSLKSLTLLLALSMVITILALRQNVLARKKSAPRILLAAIPPLSSCPRGTRMIFKGIMCCALVVACVSCKSVEVVSSSEVQEVQKFRSVDTVVVRDSVYRHDSVIYRERTIHDTVYVTKEVYRDQRLSTFDIQHSTKADTVVVTEYRDRIVEHPPEKYVPKFYKWCTGLFWAIGLLVMGRFALKLWCRV